MSKTDPLQAAIESTAGAVNAKKFKIDHILADMTADHRERFHDLLIHPDRTTWTHVRLSKILAELGYDCSEKAVKSWRTHYDRVNES